MEVFLREVLDVFRLSCWRSCPSEAGLLLIYRWGFMPVEYNLADDELEEEREIPCGKAGFLYSMGSVRV